MFRHSVYARPSSICIGLIRFMEKHQDGKGIGRLFNYHFTPIG